MKKYKGGIISLVLLVAIAGISYAQIATSCIPNTSSPWCFSGSAISTVDGVTNVGIGTVAPALQSGGTGLHIDAPSFSELKLTNSTTGATATDGTALVVSGSNFAVNNREAGELTLGTSNTVRLHIDSTGNVGIGTTAPTSPLHIQGTTATSVTEGITILNPGGVGAGTKINLAVGSDTVIARIEAANNVTGSSYLALSTWNGTLSEAMRIDKDGNVGIGTAAPATLVQLTGASTPTLYIESTTATNGGRLILEDTDGAGCSGATVLNGVVTWATVACP